MNTKTLALTIVFAAVTVALNPDISKIAVPFIPPYSFLIYQVWEIPIVAAFLIVGPRSGVMIAALNSLVLLAIFPGALITGPFYNLIANLSMLFGIYIAYKLVTHSHAGENSESALGHHVKALAVATTAIGIFFRVIITSVANYALLRQPSPIGFSYPEPAILAFLPFCAVFNATLALYTVPIGLLLAETINRNIKIQKSTTFP